MNLLEDRERESCRGVCSFKDPIFPLVPTRVIEGIAASLSESGGGDVEEDVVGSGERRRLEGERERERGREGRDERVEAIVEVAEKKEIIVLELDITAGVLI
jgi:hypothetical protein